MPSTACHTQPDPFFSDDPAEIELAKALCLGCPLIDACGDRSWGEEHGVWGGLTSAERRRRNPEAFEEGRRFHADWSHELDRRAAEARELPVPTVVTPCLEEPCENAAPKLGLRCRPCTTRRQTDSMSREVDVVALVRDGLSLNQVAGKLGLTKHQVAGVVRRARAKGIET